MQISGKLSKRIRTFMFILSLIVLFGHATHTENTKILKVFTPGTLAAFGFFFFSGFFLFRHELTDLKIIKSVLIKRSRTLLVPYLLVSGISLVYYLLPQELWTTWMKLWVTRYGDIFTLKSFVICWLLHPTAYPLWFLRSLILLVLISPLFYWSLNRFSILPILFLFMYEFNKQHFPYILHSQHVWSLIWFMIGGYISMYKIKISYGIPYPIGWFLLYLLLSYFNAGAFLKTASFLVSIWGSYKYWGDSVEKYFNRLIPYYFFIFAFHEPLLDVLSKLLDMSFGAFYLKEWIIHTIPPIVTIAVLTTAAVIIKKMPRLYNSLTGDR